MLFSVCKPNRVSKPNRPMVGKQRTVQLTVRPGWKINQSISKLITRRNLSIRQLRGVNFYIPAVTLIVELAESTKSAPMQHTNYQF